MLLLTYFTFYSITRLMNCLISSYLCGTSLDNAVHLKFRSTAVPHLYLIQDGNALVIFFNLEYNFVPIQVRNALNNTKKVEETAKKWLSLMTRDCTRFCKIMVCIVSYN